MKLVVVIYFSFMKKTIASLLFLGLTVCLSPAYAIDDPIDDTPPAPARERAQNREAPIPTMPDRPSSSNENNSSLEEGEARIQIQQSNESMQDPMLIREQAQNRVAQVHAQRVQRRFDFYNQRLTAIGDKLQNRFRALEAQGYDLSAAQEQLEQALERVELGITQARDATTQLNEVDPQQYQAQRQLALEAREQILQARISFQEAVQLFKEAVAQAIETTTTNLDQEL